MSGIISLSYFEQIKSCRWVTNLNQALVHSKLVKGESSSFVTAENIHPCHFFYGCHPLRDGSLLGQAVRPNSHGNRQDSWHGNWDSSNEKHQQVVNTISVRPLLDRVHDNELNQHAHSNWADTKVTNGCQHLMQANQKQIQKISPNLDHAQSHFLKNLKHLTLGIVWISLFRNTSSKRK